MALSAIGRSAIGTAKLMMIGLPTPTIDPLTGLNVGGRNGGAPVNGVGSCPATGPVAPARRARRAAAEPLRQVPEGAAKRLRQARRAAAPTTAGLVAPPGQPVR